MRILSTAVALAAALATGSCPALDVAAGSLRIRHPIARATAPGQQTSGAYMTIVNDGAADRLVAASAPVAASVELHEMKLEGDVMRMRRVDGIELGGGRSVDLQPGGYHVMFLGLTGPLLDGSSFPMTLHFEKAGDVAIRVEVRSPAAEPAPHH